MSEARIWTLWSFEPGVWALLGVLAIWYLYFIRLGMRKRGVPWYFGGLVVIFIALDSPIAVLGEHYLFSAHMLQHMLLEFVAAPMLVGGLPREDLERVFSTRWGRPLLRFFSQPLLAFVMGIGTLWVWHLPPAFEAVLHSDIVHIGMHLSFIFTGAWFWLPILSRLPQLRLKPLPRLVMLFTGALLNSLLGIILTFSSPTMYPTYQAGVDPYHVLPIIRQQWGFSSAFDQAFGGVLMWVLGGIIFLSFISYVVWDWMNTPEADESFGAKPEVAS